MENTNCTLVHAGSNGNGDVERASCQSSQTGNWRIVSLLPSITEILCELGLLENIVGITHECDYPTELLSLNKARVVTTSDINPRTMSQSEIHEAVCGSLKNGQSLYGINKNVLQSVRPDIIFTQSLCDVCAVSYPVVLDTCARILGGDGDVHNDKTSCPINGLDPKVVSMEPECLEDCLKTFHVAAKALDSPELLIKAKEVTTSIRRGLNNIKEVVKACSNKKPRVAFLEWHDPIFCGGHWIVDMIDIAGGEYIMPIKPGGRSIAMTNEDFIALDPDVILIGPCGFSLDRAINDTINICGKKTWWNTLRAVKGGQVYALDGNSYYARPGPRLLQGAGIMAVCIHNMQDDENRIREKLGEQLAPSSGYCRITTDMYKIDNK